MNIGASNKIVIEAFGQFFVYKSVENFTDFRSIYMWQLK